MIFDCAKSSGRAGTLVPAALLFTSAIASASAANNDEVVVMEPVVVTATRFEGDAALVPASIQLVDANTIAATAASSIADILGDVGVLMRSYTGNPAQSQIDMRGYGESGNLNVLVLVDGRRINAPDMSGINWLNMPLAGVDRVEVLRGSQSALYGNNAGGGVIKITTKVPHAPGASVIAGAGSWNTSVLRAAAWTPISDSVRISSEIGSVESDGYRDNSGYRTRVANTTLQGKHGRAEWLFSAGCDSNYFEYPGPLGRTDFLNNPRKSGYAPYESEYNGDSDTVWTGASVGWKDDTIDLRMDANGSRKNLSWNMGLGSGAESTLDTWTTAPRMQLIFENGLSAIVGADGEYDYLYLTRYSDLEHTSRTAHANLKRLTGGAYASLSYEVKSERPLSFDATARFQRHSLDASIPDDSGDTGRIDNSKSGVDSAFSLGSTWRPWHFLRLWARGDRFFRYPAIDEVVAYQGYVLTVPFNADLRSERGWSGEIGADVSFRHFILKVDAFAQDVDGLIAFDYLQNLNVNLANATRAGVETGIQGSFGDFRCGIFHTYVKVTFNDGPYDGKELYLVPNNQFSGFVEWAPGRFSARIGGQYIQNCWQGNDFENKRSKLPGYFVMNVVLRYRIGQRWHLFAGADNVLDRHYASLEYSGVWYPAAGLGLRGGVQWRY